MEHAYLRKSIVAIVAMMAAGHSISTAANGNNNSSGTELDPIVVYVPSDPGGPIGIGNEGGWDVGDGGGDDSSGGGGDDSSGGGGDEPQSCPILRALKPDNCDGFQNVYATAWGRDKIPSGSGLGKVYSLLGSGFTSLSPQSWNIINDALTLHTNTIAGVTADSRLANEALISSVRVACQNNSTGPIGWGIGTCYGALRQLIAEYDGSADKTRNFWEGLDIPGLIVNWVAPDNSLRIRFQTMQSAVKCNNWHKDMVRNGC